MPTIRYDGAVWSRPPDITAIVEQCARKVAERHPDYEPEYASGRLQTELQALGVLIDHPEWLTEMGERIAGGEYAPKRPLGGVQRGVDVLREMCAQCGEHLEVEYADMYVINRPDPVRTSSPPRCPRRHQQPT